MVKGLVEENMRGKRVDLPYERTAKKLVGVIAVLLFPPASLLAALPGCAGSTCKLTCNETNVCLTGGCFHDDKSQCADYVSALEWDTAWEKNASVHCQQLLDASGHEIGVTCVGTSGEPQDIRCTCNFVMVGGVRKCG